MSVHGTARFATRDELERTGLLGDWTPGAAPPGGLLLGWWWESPYDFAPITYSGDLHQIIVGGTGGGKFTTAIAPLLLGSGLEENTVVVVDPKGEIANLAGPFFQKAFAEQPSVFVIDPWDVCGTGSTSCVNVLDPIRPENPNYVDDARALADAMIIPSGAENTHWDNAARNFLTGVVLYVALAPEEAGKRDLIRVRDIIALSWAMPKAYTGPKRETLSDLLFKHLASDLAGGAVGRAFRTLLNREDKERSGIISSIERDTAWIDSAPMAAVLKGPGLDLKEGVVEGRKYFIVLPADYFMTHRAWLRLMVTAFAKAMKRYKPDRGRPQAQRWRHIVIDEFATLGEMSFMLNGRREARA
jgi:type IV secretion system protein VirD4